MSGKLTRIEEDAVDVQIAHRSDATALKFRTGNGTLGSTPLGDISPVLTDARRAHYQCGQSQNRLGLASPSKGDLSFLQCFAKLKEKFDTEFLVNSGIHSPTFILDTPASEEHARHGFVVDGDHSFFKSGVLLAACSWSRVLNKWAPVLYTWIDRQDIAHHRPHFKHLFGQIVQASGSKFQAKLLLHSAAARAAHAAEYSATMTSQLINCGFLSAEAQQVEIQHFQKEASQYLVGCKTHWLGINHDLIGGLERLYLHVRQLEGKYHAVKDTIEALEKASKSTTYYQESGQKGNSNQSANDGTSSLPHALKSYIWSSPNSCFLDVGTELLHCAFIGLNPELKKNMFNALKPSSHLGGLFYHFQRRQDWEEDRNGHVIAGTRELALYQGILWHLIFNKWQLYDAPSDFGYCFHWPLTYAATTAE
ncbi:hypothetical protein JB92DRAFT_2824550 [Gautieria morchelliformis]|nr:hypothetical protein JB92DRAFT_2824550 [Gautieria morchelliformis]